MYVSYLLKLCTHYIPSFTNHIGDTLPILPTRRLASGSVQHCILHHLVVLSLLTMHSPGDGQNEPLQRFRPKDLNHERYSLGEWCFHGFSGA